MSLYPFGNVVIFLPKLLLFGVSRLIILGMTQSLEKQKQKYNKISRRNIVMERFRYLLLPLDLKNQLLKGIIGKIVQIILLLLSYKTI
jgi:hypothetical protein